MPEEVGLPVGRGPDLIQQAPADYPVRDRFTGSFLQFGPPVQRVGARAGTLSDSPAAGQAMA